MTPEDQIKELEKRAKDLDAENQQLYERARFYRTQCDEKEKQIQELKKQIESLQSSQAG